MADLESRVSNVLVEEQVTPTYWRQVCKGVKDYLPALIIGGVAATYFGELPAKYEFDSTTASTSAAYLSGSIVGYAVYFAQQAVVTKQNLEEFFHNAAAFIVSDCISDQFTFTPTFGATVFLLEQYTTMTSDLRNAVAWTAASSIYILGMSHLQPKINKKLTQLKSNVMDYCRKGSCT